MKRLVLLLPFVLGGCSSLADAPLIGLPQNAPARPEATGAYPAVHDIPPARTGQTLSAAEQTRMEAELTQARARQKSAAAADAAAIARAGSKTGSKTSSKANSRTNSRTSSPANPAANPAAK